MNRRPSTIPTLDVKSKNWEWLFECGKPQVGDENPFVTFFFVTKYGVSHPVFAPGVTDTAERLVFEAAR
jgi:hypothetical protein